MALTKRITLFTSILLLLPFQIKAQATGTECANDGECPDDDPAFTGSCDVSGYCICSTGYHLNENSCVEGKECDSPSGTDAINCMGSQFKDTECVDYTCKCNVNYAPKLTDCAFNGKDCTDNAGCVGEEFTGICTSKCECAAGYHATKDSCKKGKVCDYFDAVDLTNCPNAPEYSNQFCSDFTCACEIGYYPLTADSCVQPEPPTGKSCAGDSTVCDNDPVFDGCDSTSCNCATNHHKTSDSCKEGQACALELGEDFLNCGGINNGLNAHCTDYTCDCAKNNMPFDLGCDKPGFYCTGPSDCPVEPTILQSCENNRCRCSSHSHHSSAGCSPGKACDWYLPTLDSKCPDSVEYTGICSDFTCECETGYHPGSDIGACVEGKECTEAGSADDVNCSGPQYSATKTCTAFTCDCATDYYPIGDDCQKLGLDCSGDGDCGELGYSGTCGLDSKCGCATNYHLTKTGCSIGTACSHVGTDIPDLSNCPPAASYDNQKCTDFTCVCADGYHQSSTGCTEGKECDRDSGTSAICAGEQFTGTCIDRTCECEDGFYISGEDCVPKGLSCTSNGDCNPSTGPYTGSCSGPSGLQTCECDLSTHKGVGKCEPGIECDYLSQPDLTNCVGTSVASAVCAGFTCPCATYFKPSGDQCEPIGKSCTSSNENVNCLGDEYTGTCGADLTCDCATGFTKTLDSCVPGVGCSSAGTDVVNSDCPATNSYDSQKCTEYVCKCASGFHPTSKGCLEGTPCIHFTEQEDATNCIQIGHVAAKTCIDYTCVCKDNYGRIGGECLPLGLHCFDSFFCDIEIFDNCVNEKCTCATDFHLTTDSCALGTPCDYHAAALDSNNCVGVQYSQTCEDFTCQCAAGYAVHTSGCVAIGKVCSSDSDCDSSVEKDGFTGACGLDSRCTCRPGFAKTVESCQAGFSCSIDDDCPSTTPGFQGQLCDYFVCLCSSDAHSTTFGCTFGKECDYFTKQEDSTNCNGAGYTGMCEDFTCECSDEYEPFEGICKGRGLGCDDSDGCDGAAYDGTCVGEVGHKTCECADKYHRGETSCNAGRPCTDGSLDCLDTEYFGTCTDFTCDCDIEYKVFEDRCIGKGLGCSSDSHCVGQEYTGTCGVDNTCDCKDGLHKTNTGCGPGKACDTLDASTDEDNCPITAEYATSDCADYTCLCNGPAYHPGLGACVEGVQCDFYDGVDITKCANPTKFDGNKCVGYTCVCADGFRVSGNDCVLKGKACTAAFAGSECADSTRFADPATCTSGRCVCREGFVAEGETCVIEKCGSDADCAASEQALTGTCLADTKLCECSSDFHSTSIGCSLGKACDKDGIDEVDAANCGDSSQFDSSKCTAGSCVCATLKHPTSTGCAFGKRCDKNGEADSSNCNGDNFASSMCVDYTCVCADDFVVVENDCAPLGLRCSSNTPCQADAITYTGVCTGPPSQETCICNVGYHKVEAGCSLGKKCGLSNGVDSVNCNGAIYDSQQCTDYTCVCAQFYKPGPGDCVPIGKTCTGPSECAGDQTLSGSCEGSGVCECAAGHHKTLDGCATGQACPEKGIDIVSDSCPDIVGYDGQKCTDHTCVCDSFYHATSAGCSLGLGCLTVTGDDASSCVTSDKLDGNKCEDYTCVCADDYYIVGPDCIKKGQSCGDSDKTVTCADSSRYKDPPSCPVDRCECRDGFELFENTCAIELCESDTDCDASEPGLTGTCVTETKKCECSSDYHDTILGCSLGIACDKNGLEENDAVNCPDTEGFEHPKCTGGSCVCDEFYHPTDTGCALGKACDKKNAVDTINCDDGKYDGNKCEDYTCVCADDFVISENDCIPLGQKCDSSGDCDSAADAYTGDCNGPNPLTKTCDCGPGYHKGEFSCKLGKKCDHFSANDDVNCAGEKYNSFFCSDFTCSCAAFYKLGPNDCVPIGQTCTGPSECAGDQTLSGDCEDSGVCECAPGHHKTLDGCATGRPCPEAGGGVVSVSCPDTEEYDDQECTDFTCDCNSGYHATSEGCSPGIACDFADGDDIAKCVADPKLDGSKCVDYTCVCDEDYYIVGADCILKGAVCDDSDVDIVCADETRYQGTCSGSRCNCRGGFVPFEDTCAIEKCESDDDCDASEAGLTGTCLSETELCECSPDYHSTVIGCSLGIPCDKDGVDEDDSVNCPDEPAFNYPKCTAGSCVCSTNYHPTDTGCAEGKACDKKNGADVVNCDDGKYDENKCEDYTCVCAEDFVAGSDDCFPLGKTCADNNACDGGLDKFTGTCSGPVDAETCECAVGYHKVDNDCSLGKKCDVSNGRDDINCNGDAYESALCQDYTCACADFYKVEGDDCVPIGQACTGPSDCNGDQTLSGVCEGSGVCECAPGHTKTIDGCSPGLACPEKSVTTPSDVCPDSDEYSSQWCSEYVCDCAADYHKTSKGCSPGIECDSVDDDDSTNCPTGTTLDGNKCIDYTCVCADGYYAFEDDCVLEGKPCTSSNAGSVCVDVNGRFFSPPVCNSDLRCDCASGFVAEENTCVKDLCTEDADCDSGSDPTLSGKCITETGKCECVADYNPTSLGCSLGKACSKLSQETDIENCPDSEQFDNRQCEDFICHCSTGYHETTDGCSPGIACDEKNADDPTNCPTADKLDGNLCVDYSCVCSEGYFASGADCVLEGKVCSEGSKFGDCSGKQFLSPATCSVNLRCLCAPGYTEKEDDCVPDTCSSDADCDGSDPALDGTCNLNTDKCSCAEGYHPTEAYCSLGKECSETGVAVVDTANCPDSAEYSSQECTDKTCICAVGYHKTSTGCVPGIECSFADADDLANCITSDKLDGNKCVDYTCVCAEGFYAVLDACIPEGKECTVLNADTVCVGEQFAVPASCTVDRCDCAEKFIKENDDCVRDGCQTDDHCDETEDPTLSGSCITDLEKCECGVNHHETSEGCKPGKECNEDGDGVVDTENCPSEEEYDGQKCSDRTCDCSEGYHASKESCVAGIPCDCIDCEDEENCETDEKLDGNKCQDYTCVCSDDFYIVGADCIRKGKVCSEETKETDCEGDAYLDPRVCVNERCNCTEDATLAEESCESDFALPRLGHMSTILMVIPWIITFLFKPRFI